jgi:hypothetical protein
MFALGDDDEVPNSLARRGPDSWVVWLAAGQLTVD